MHVRFTFKDGKLFIRGNFDDDRESECTYFINAKPSPTHLDFFPPMEKNPILGIYEVKGSVLKVCVRYAGSSKSRPASFATNAGSELVFLVFKKKP